MILVALCAIATAPIPFAGAQTRWWAGLPVWLWWSLGFTALLSGLTCYAILRLWRDDDD